ncbi:F0F1 ATP synthase subunit epsilon [Halotalea alkalilenta]|uniref:F0F1 ATP synthase subunit epsilon n=1 Tax=Halotalea alkalilenta TaxID=376489 RepID=UPI000480510A|nr:F0F1 ATP synthase subunit epsilon [Halotalea alkalilenta]
MANSFQCDIVSVETAIFSGKVSQVVVTGSEGELGIRAGHEPLLTLLAPGPVQVTREGGQEEVFYVSGGFLEVQPDMVSILADTAARARDLDEASAQRVRDEAQRAIGDKKAQLDYSSALADIAEANARLRTLNELKRRKS